MVKLPPCEDCATTYSIGGAWVSYEEEDEWVCGECLVKRALKLKEVQHRLILTETWIAGRLDLQELRRCKKGVQVIVDNRKKGSDESEDE